MNYSEEYDKYIGKIANLNSTIWGGKIFEPQIEEWLNNFEDEKEKIHVLYLLSMFMYFGEEQMRTIVKSVYRDLFKYPIIEDLRRSNNDTLNLNLLNTKFLSELNETRFLGLGNPSESGSFLLYSFRQENELPKKLFIHEHEITKRNQSSNQEELREKNVKRYIFIDDFSGTGSQAIKYSANNRIQMLKGLNPDIKVFYFSLFATSEAKEKILNQTAFDNVECIIELDSSYRVFDTQSRYRTNVDNFIDMDYAENICRKYGRKLMKIICEEEGCSSSNIDICAESNALGFRDSQLLIGFNHNTPDNTLPIIWFNSKKLSWTPIIKRYNKVY